MVYFIILSMTPDDLKVWRKQNGYTQADLARALGVTSLTVSRWERGDRQMASFLRLALEALERRGGEKRPRETKKKTRKEVKRNG
jgi:transcriptional regulator with XRE-family HTH domain